MKLYTDKETGETFQYNDKLVSLWSRGQKFIENDILPFLLSEEDNPEMWVDEALRHNEDPELMTIVRDALRDHPRTLNGKPAGIKQATDARGALAWYIVDELRLNLPKKEN